MNYFKNAAWFAGLAATAAFVAFTFDSKSDTRSLKNTHGQEYQWTMATGNAAFAKSYNFQLFASADRLWAFHPEGNYFTNDGKSWIRSGLTNTINNHAFLDYVQFKDALWGLGSFKGNIEKFEFSTIITRSTDLQSWDTLTVSSNLPQRFFYHPVVFRNKIWIFGGSDGKQEFDDAWSSEDAVHWKQETTSLPFGKRARQHFIVFQNKLYMLDNDVWVTDDGTSWTKVSDSITNAKLYGYSPVVFDEKIWLLGCNRNGQFASKVYVSSDGSHWLEQDAPWSPRGGIAATVYEGKLYMTGGKYGGFREGTTETEFVYSNDVWVLERSSNIKK